MKSAWTQVALLLLLIAGACTYDASARQVADADDTLYLARGQQDGEVAVSAVYQKRSKDDIEIDELAIPIAFRFPLPMDFGVSFASTVVGVSGADLDSERALSNAQVQLSYSSELGGGVAVYSLTANLPTGDNLNGNQFDTSILMSQHIFDLAVPGFGRALILKPSATWAYPYSERLVVGFGASFLRASDFKPLRNSESKYRQGNEVTVTAGFDVRVAAATTMALDATYSFVGDDQVGSDDYFETDNRLTASAQVHHRIGGREFALSARYRSRSEGSIVFSNPGFEPGQAAIPELFETSLGYTHPLTTEANLLAFARLRHHGETGEFFLTSGETIAFDATTLLSVGVMPSIQVSERMKMQLSLQYTAVGMTGLDLGVGIRRSI